MAHKSGQQCGWAHKSWVGASCSVGTLLSRQGGKQCGGRSDLRAAIEQQIQSTEFKLEPSITNLETTHQIDKLNEFPQDAANPRTSKFQPTCLLVNEGARHASHHCSAVSSCPRLRRHGCLPPSAAASATLLGFLRMCGAGEKLAWQMGLGA